MNKTIAVYLLGVLVVLLCIGASTAKYCADHGGHWYLLWCTPAK